MKLEGLKELVKEELKRALGDIQNTPLEKLEAGTYKVEYITEDPVEGGPDLPGSVTKSFTKEDFENSSKYFETLAKQIKKKLDNLIDSKNVEQQRIAGELKLMNNKRKLSKYSR